MKHYQYILITKITDSFGTLTAIVMNYETYKEEELTYFEGEHHFLDYILRIELCK